MNVRLCSSLIVVAIAGCEIPRERNAGDGYHEAGWVNTFDGGKHAPWLKQAGYPIEDCQVCHGADGHESPVLVSCNQAGCHEKGVSFCGTCHGDSHGPRPSSGAHDKHAAYCEECHAVPKSLRDGNHLNGVLEVAFGGLAKHNQAAPAWDETTRRCTNSYCHGATSNEWENPGPAPTPCTTCHGNPPDSHARFSAVAKPANCSTCHPNATDATHLNGSLETNPMPCNTCHGQGDLGAPPADLEGSTDPTHRGVGAHRRHLDPTLADRIGKVAACSVCHSIPSNDAAKGHIDTTAPADVNLTLGHYDSSTGQCVTSCHFDKSPGPSWTDTTGTQRACNACHGYPPAFTRKGTPHTPSSTCLSCHTFTPETHVDGVVDMTP